MKKSLYLTTTFALFLLGATTFFISSCSKTDISEPSATDNIENSLAFTSQIEIKDGIMYFPTQELYEYTLDWLFEHQDNLIDFSNRFPSFKSSHQAYDEIDFSEINPDALTKEQANFLYTKPYDDESFDVLPVVDIYLLSQIVNEEGLIWIGNSIFKYRYEEAIEVNSSDLNALRNQNINDNQIIQILPITRSVHHSYEYEESVDSRDDRRDECVNYYDRHKNAWKYKVNGVLKEIRQSNTLVALQAQTTHRRRCIFGAWCKEENGLALKVEGQYIQQGTIQTTGNIYFNQSSAGHTFGRTLRQCHCDDLSFLSTIGTHTVTRSDDPDNDPSTISYLRCWTSL